MLFGRSKKPAQLPDTAVMPVERIELDLLIATLGPAANRWVSGNVPEELIRARLADAYRDQQIPPVAAEVFSRPWEMLEEQGRRRFAVLTQAFDVGEVLEALPRLVTSTPARDEPLRRLHSLVAELNLLTVDVVCESDIRLEELARHFCSSWEVAIKDETASQSTKRLHEINFARLMAEAEAAKSSAEDRMAYLRQMQQEQEATRRPRRGKW